ncbi:MAG: family 1 glycosylhydrolase [Candidatus Nanohaloarchaea archaeon]|nr:family 1 glycosylhydrolase [Candidatus Nanohaloarchaea archaeon]
MQGEDDFLWGAAISPHQVDSSENTDWARWEEEYAGELADRAALRFADLEAWDDIAEEATDPANYRSQDGIHHMERYEDDLDLVADHNLNAVRTGFEWGEVQPSPDSFDRDTIQQYHDYLDAMEERGIEPVITLWHFTNPDWFVDDGSWHGDSAVQHFKDYVERMVDEFGDRVDHWVTLNEPSAWVRAAYGMGNLFPNGVTWPGGATEDSILPVNPVKMYRAYTSLAEAHHAAYDIIKENNPEAKIGTANSIGAWRPYNESRINNAICSVLEQIEYRDWLDRTEDSVDFIGVNHYVPIDVDYRLRGNNYPRSDMGWPTDPGSLEEVVRKIDEEYEQPVIITEHGLADREDEQRQDMIEGAVESVREMREDGVDIQGYLHWSLLDNFEWDKGYWPRFGLVEIDHEDDFERTPRTSFERYADLIRDT